MIEAGIVSGWDDPRMPTLCGLRRRGYTPASIHNFSSRNGVAKVNSVVDFAFLEYCLREDLNDHAQRAMAVLKPVKLIIDNYPEDASEEFDVENNPKDENAGTRKVSFSRASLLMLLSAYPAITMQMATLRLFTAHTILNPEAEILLTAERSSPLSTGLTQRQLLTARSDFTTGSSQQSSLTLLTATIWTSSILIHWRSSRALNWRHSSRTQSLLTDSSS